jgi:hypothetical protein
MYVPKAPRLGGKTLKLRYATPGRTFAALHPSFLRSLLEFHELSPPKAQRHARRTQRAEWIKEVPLCNEPSASP